MPTAREKARERMMVSYYKFEASHPKGVKCWANDEVSIHQMVKEYVEQCPDYGPVTAWTIGPQVIKTTKEPNMTEYVELHTLPQVQDQETQMMQNLFQRAADTIVNASKLGREVNELRDQMKKLVDDANRMRDHIKWLEEENATLRTQRDESQNVHNADRQHWAIVEAGLNNQLEARQRAIDTTKYDIDVLRTAHVKALDEAKLWQEEATKLEHERNTLVTHANNLQKHLDRISERVHEYHTDTDQKSIEYHQKEWQPNDNVIHGSPHVLPSTMAHKNPDWSGETEHRSPAE